MSTLFRWGWDFGSAPETVVSRNCGIVATSPITFYGRPQDFPRFPRLCKSFRRPIMEIQFITDARGKRTAAIIPFDEWERTEKAKDILEHVYLAGIIKERKNSEPSVNLDDLLNAERLTRADLES